MADYCENVLFVQGCKEELERFKEFAHEGYSPLSENRFIPYPEKYRVLDEQIGPILKLLSSGITVQTLRNIVKKGGFNSGGYEWCCENWGTKWGLLDVRIGAESDNEVIYEFCTAWTPALPVIKKMGEMFPELKFVNHYHDEWWRFKGTFSMENGRCVEDSFDEQTFSGNESARN